MAPCEIACVFALACVVSEVCEFGDCGEPLLNCDWIVFVMPLILMVAWLQCHEKLTEVDDWLGSFSEDLDGWVEDLSHPFWCFALVWIVIVALGVAPALCGAHSADAARVKVFQNIDVSCAFST